MDNPSLPCAVPGSKNHPSRQSLRKSIDGMCRACLYDPKSGAGGWREQVSACTSTGCPLFAVRPRSAAHE